MRVRARRAWEFEDRLREGKRYSEKMLGGDERKNGKGKSTFGMREGKGGIF